MDADHLQRGEFRAGLHDVGDARAPLDDVVDRRVARIVLGAERGGCIALRIHVDHEHVHAGQRERCRQIHRRARLAHAALLIGDGDAPRLRGLLELQSFQCMQARRCIRDFRADTGILMVGKDSRNGVFGAFELRAAPWCVTKIPPHIAMYPVSSCIRTNMPCFVSCETCRFRIRPSAKLSTSPVDDCG